MFLNHCKIHTSQLLSDLTTVLHADTTALQTRLYIYSQVELYPSSSNIYRSGGNLIDEILFTSKIVYKLFGNQKNDYFIKNFMQKLQ